MYQFDHDVLVVLKTKESSTPFNHSICKENATKRLLELINTCYMEACLSCRHRTSQLFNI